MDGVICNNTYGDYDNAKPYKDVISKINSIYEDGNYVLIYTSRYMGKLNGDTTKVVDFGYEKTKKQLDMWGLKYNKIQLGKPEYDVIIDDKSLFYNSNWINQI